MRQFQTGENITGCHLRGLKYHSKDISSPNGWEAIDFYFERGTRQLKHRFFFPLERMDEPSDKWYEKFCYVKCQVERIGICYLGRETMADINRRCVKGGVDDYFKELEKEFKKINYRDIDVVLKVTKDAKTGYPRIPYFGEFIRRDEEGGKNFSFSEYEKKILNKFDISDNKYSDEPF